MKACLIFLSAIYQRIINILHAWIKIERDQSPNLMNFSRVSNTPKDCLIWAPAKSWKIENNFNWNEPYLSRGLNSLSSASDEYARKTNTIKKRI